MALDSMKEIFERSAREEIPFWEIVLQYDMEERQVSRQASMAKMLSTWQAIQDAADSYTGTQRSVSGLVGGDGLKMRLYARRGESIGGEFIDEVIVQALSMAESNACMRRIVAAPTAGSCGAATSSAPAGGVADSGAAISAPASAASASAQGSQNVPAEIPAGALAKHYGGKQFEYGFASVCKMLLPREELKGKKVLDICCRRGRGVYKLSSLVGDGGEVMGVDWSPSYVEEAKDGMSRAGRESGLSRNNMEFRVAFPEDLIGAGIGSSVYDAIYVNNVITLFYDQEQAIREFGRVLKPGGLLILETIFADRPRTDSVVDEARSIGNSVQAARTEQENFAWLEAAGFEAPSVEESFEVEADRGYKAGHIVPKVAGDENVKFTAVSLYVRKKR